MRPKEPKNKGVSLGLPDNIHKLNTEQYSIFFSDGKNVESIKNCQAFFHRPPIDLHLKSLTQIM